MVHCYVNQMNTLEKFYMTFIYGANSLAERVPLWNDLRNVGQFMPNPWCELGDFNVVLHFRD